MPRCSPEPWYTPVWLECFAPVPHCLLLMGEIVLFSVSRVEEVNWANWEKEVGVIKEDPGISNVLQTELVGKTSQG